MSTPDSGKEKYQYSQNRELSWLRFNRRVLEESADKNVPMLERLKFIAIFSSNLDEFFMVRVGSLFDMAHITPNEIDNKSGLTAKEQLVKIYDTVPGLIEQKERSYKTLMDELASSGIVDVPASELEADERKAVNKFFKNELLPVLSPIIIGAHHPIPHLVGKYLYIAALLKDKKGHEAVGIIPVPSSLDSYLMLDDNQGRYIRTETIILDKVEALFGSYTVVESCTICVTRNADISFDDDKFEDIEDDFRKKVSKLLKKRDHLSVVRLEINNKISDDFTSKLAKMVNIDKKQIFFDSCPLNMKYIYKLIGELTDEKAIPLQYKPYQSRWPEDLEKGVCMIPQIQRKDRLLFYPYDSVEPFLNLLSEAAEDPNVLSIKITIYRLASSSKIARILCRAAENGKEVLVLMELRARFDEANNLNWSKVLEESGCQVIYGIEDYKCHSKICLISMRNRGKMSYITQIGTGNYNEKTNALYTDLSLMTSSDAIGEDATLFFRNMLVNNLDGKYNELCVSPFGIKSKICQLIDEEIKKGTDGYICIKANAVTERDLITKLSEASRAGVEIQLIIRGICCVLPGISGYTDNVHISSIVGRYLEHARIYLFGKGENEKIYISSADIMTRNLNRRVEIACPVQDPELRDNLKWILDMQLKDTAKASFMLSDGTYCRKSSLETFDSQENFMETSFHKVQAQAPIKLNVVEKLKALFSKK